MKYLVTISLRVYFWVRRWKRFENRSTFSKVMGKSRMSCSFDSTHEVKTIGFYRATLYISAVFAVARCPSLCLSIRLSATFVYCIQTAEDSVELFTYPVASSF